MAFLDRFRRAPAALTESPALARLSLDIQNAVVVHKGDPQAGAFTHAVYRTMGDTRVNPDSSMQVAAVWACMDVIASALSSSNWNVYGGIRDEANKKALPRDALQYILNTRFNEEMTAQAGKRAMLLGAVGMGNGYAEIDYDMAGRIRALWPIAPNRVEARRDEKTGRLFYRVAQEYGGGTVDLEPDKLFIIRGASLVGFAGDNILSHAVRTIATALAIDQYAEAFFGNNAQLGTVFMYKGGNMDDKNYERAKDSLNQKHRGSRKAYTTGLFTGEWDVKTFGSNMVDAALAEIKNHSIDDICRWFHVPPHKIAHLVKSTNNNIEHQGLEFSRDSLRPWVHEIQQEADYKLIPWRGEPRFVELDVDWTEQGDYKSRAEAYAVLRNIGVLTGNDVARKLGENTFGADGDIRYVQGANVRLEDVGAAYLDNPGDEVAQAWLTQVYSRVKRRVEAAKADPKRRDLGPETRNFAAAVVADLAAVLGDRLDEAHAQVLEVINGVEPEVAARAVFTKGKS